jgi:hypothetical protein
MLAVMDGMARYGKRPPIHLLLFPMAPWILVAFGKNAWTIGSASFLSIFLLVTVSWRFGLALKEESAEADERYDTEGKYKLSAEYHDTESATAVAKRRPPKP